MATTQPAAKTATPKPKKDPIAVSKRLTDQMKRAALNGKLTSEELDSLANLATALKTFISV